jgi:hypothetical protein
LIDRKEWFFMDALSHPFPQLFQCDPAFPDPFFYSMQSGLMVCSAVHAAVEVELARHLESPQPLDALAQATQTHAPTLLLLLRALSSIGIFTEIDVATHTYAHTERSRLLLPEIAGPMAPLVKLWGAPYQWDCWRDLAFTIRTGQPVMQQAYVSYDSIWTYLQDHPHDRRTFQQGLAAVSELIIPAILATYDFSKRPLVVDVGGGHGRLALSLLRQVPTLHVILFDQEEMIDVARQEICDSQPADLLERLSFASGDFFQSVPAEADVYVLKNVLMDWSDEDALRILRVCRNAMGDHPARLLVIESVMSAASPFTAFFSLQMAMLMRAARHRTYSEHHALLSAAGFTPLAARSLGLEQVLLESRPSVPSSQEVSA